MTAEVTSVDQLQPVFGDPPTAPASPDPTTDGHLRNTGRSWNTGVQFAVGTTYALLITALWVPFGPRNGMGYETTLVYLSESHSFFEGFFYGDPLRRFAEPRLSLDLLLRDTYMHSAIRAGAIGQAP